MVGDGGQYPPMPLVVGDGGDGGQYPLMPLMPPMAGDGGDGGQYPPYAPLCHFVVGNGQDDPLVVGDGIIPKMPALPPYAPCGGRWRRWRAIPPPLPNCLMNT